MHLQSVAADDRLTFDRILTVTVVQTKNTGILKKNLLTILPNFSNFMIKSGI